MLTTYKTEGGAINLQCSVVKLLDFLFCWNQFLELRILSQLLGDPVCARLDQKQLLGRTQAPSADLAPGGCNDPNRWLTPT